MLHATTNCLATDFFPAHRLTDSYKTVSAAQTVCGLQEALHLQHCARFKEFNRFEFLKFGGGGALCVLASVWANKCTKVQLCGLHVALPAMAAPLCRTVGPCQWVVRLPAEKHRQKRPHQLWGPPSPVLSGRWGSGPRGKVPVA
jgi:hypothetical protein